METIAGIVFSAYEASWESSLTSRVMHSRRNAASRIGQQMLALAALMWALSLAAGCQSRSTANSAVLSACGSTINAQFDGEAKTVSRADLLDWIQRAGDAVCTYYGKFPVPRLKLDIHVRGGGGVHSGTTYPDGGGYTTISLGESTSRDELEHDWMLTHEMIHLAFPSMARTHHWIEEGISVYVEPIARVQAGQLSAERMWSEVVRDVPQGEPGSGDNGLDRTHTWGTDLLGRSDVLPRGRRAHSPEDGQP